MYKKKIAFLTATRADYGKLKSLINETQKQKNFKTYVLVAGMHNLSFFGNTIKEIKKDKIKYTNRSFRKTQSSICKNY